MSAAYQPETLIQVETIETNNAPVAVVRGKSVTPRHCDRRPEFAPSRSKPKHLKATSNSSMPENRDNDPKADILVVDDTPENIRLLSNILLNQGYAVRQAINGTTALKAAQTLLPDLILLDINMPDMNGYEVCERLKSDPHTASTPVMFLSALGETADKVRAFKVGGVDYIPKPFQVDEVLARIENQLTIQQLQTQLHNQNGQLQQALKDLKQAEAQLIQKEKMVGLGQLVAGIVHEINNPVTFIDGNLRFVNEYVQELLNLVKLFCQEYPTPTEAVQAAMEEVDLNFIAADLPNLTGSMRVGVQRIQSIILALRIFSRLDEANFKTVDIHKGIESALLLLQHRLHQDAKTFNIEIIKDYGELPSITCHASKLNQVFLNLFNNAIDALEQRYDSERPDGTSTPKIWIQTELTTADTVRIQIKDNGMGMAEDVRSQIFNPFFTTKPVGQGTGLGLSTSYQIVVNNHCGQLTCQSNLREGTEFVVEIPVRSAACKKLQEKL